MPSPVCPFDASRTPAIAEGFDTVRTLVELVPAPAHLPCMKQVAKTCYNCLILLKNTYPSTPNRVTEVINGIAPIASEVNVGAEEEMMGFVANFPAWAWLSSSSFPTSTEIRIVIGKLLAIAILKQVAIDKYVIRSLRSLLRQQTENSISIGQINQALCKIKNQVNKRFINLVELSAVSRNNQQLVFNSAVNSKLSNSLSSVREHERMAVCGDRCLSVEELNLTATKLRSQAEQGSPDDLAILLCMCIGLGWELGKQTPLSTSENGSGYVAWINPLAGWIYVDLNHVLKDLSKKAAPSHIGSTLLLKRPLPESVATLLQNAYRQNNQLQFVGDLTVHKMTSRKKLSLENAHHSSSLANLLASIRSTALSTIGRRDVAAFACLAFELLNKSDLHYICPRLQDIWQGNSSIYQSIGLGNAVPANQESDAIRIGSRVTPASTWIQAIFNEASAYVDSQHCGKRYKLDRLIAHHNAYACYVGFFIHMAVGGRHRKEINFDADMWAPNQSFGLIEEKPLSQTKGRTPIPIPSALNEQICLWRAHIQALNRRLKKLDARGSNETSKRITAIIQAEKVQLLFSLDANGFAQAVSNERVFTGLAQNLNRDFGRHFLTDQLLEIGVSFEDIQDWLRHFSNGTSSSINTSHRNAFGYIQRLSAGIDRVLTNLSIHPKAGLSKAAPK